MLHFVKTQPFRGGKDEVWCRMRTYSWQMYVCVEACKYLPMKLSLPCAIFLGILTFRRATTALNRIMIKSQGLLHFMALGDYNN